MPTRDVRRGSLLYEATTEGGAGVLTRLVSHETSLATVARTALEIEPVREARFPLPSAHQLGGHDSALLLRDALLLSLRRGAGPFRSFGQISVEPRAYQLVPLLMALKLDPVRLLIADDVGVGKTIEALLIARELLDRGDVDRTVVLCPPHLVDQWVTELDVRFNIRAAAVTARSARRLERGIPPGVSIFAVHPHTVVSLDYIKTPEAVLLRRRGGSAIHEDRQLELFESHWEDVKARAKKNRTLFAQRRIKPDEVLPEWRKSLVAVGGRDDVQRFAGRALARLGSGLEPLGRGFKAPTAPLPDEVRERLAAEDIAGTVAIDFAYPAAPGCRPVQRSHPLVAVLAETLLGRTLSVDDGDAAAGDPSVLGRAGCWISEGVRARVTVVLLRLRHQLLSSRRGREPLIVEEATALAWAGPRQRRSPGPRRWVCSRSRPRARRALRRAVAARRVRFCVRRGRRAEDDRQSRVSGPVLRSRRPGSHRRRAGGRGPRHPAARARRRPAPPERLRAPARDPERVRHNALGPRHGWALAAHRARQREPHAAGVDRSRPRPDLHGGPVSRLRRALVARARVALRPRRRPGRDVPAGGVAGGGP